MPIYEYYCPACHGRFSALQKIGEAPPPCPRCQSTGVEKMVSAAGVVRSEAERRAAFEAARCEVDPNDRQAIARFFREADKEMARQYEGEIAASDAFGDLIERVEGGAGESEMADLVDSLADAANSPYPMLGPESDPDSRAFVEFAKKHEAWSKGVKRRSAEDLGWA